MLEFCLMNFTFKITGTFIIYLKIVHPSKYSSISKQKSTVCSPNNNKMLNAATVFNVSGSGLLDYLNHQKILFGNVGYSSVSRRDITPWRKNRKTNREKQQTPFFTFGCWKSWEIAK